MKLTIDNGHGSRPLAEVELGEPDNNGYLASDEVPGANIYIYLDGKEYGSLFFHEKDGRVQITLGQYDDEHGEWTERNPLRETVQEIIDREEAKHHE